MDMHSKELPLLSVAIGRRLAGRLFVFPFFVLL